MTHHLSRTASDRWLTSAIALWSSSTSAAPMNANQRSVWTAPRALWDASSSSSAAAAAEALPASDPREALGPISVGQPTHDTHPELLAHGELTPGVSAAEYAGRRKWLMGALPPRSLVVLASAAPTLMSGVIPYPFRQDPDFFYLTGLQQRGVAVLFSPAEGECVYTLFVDDQGGERAQWDGASVDVDAAVEVFGADRAYTTSEMPAVLKRMAGQAEQLFADADRPAAFCAPALLAALHAAAPPHGAAAALGLFGSGPGALFGGNGAAAAAAAGRGAARPLRHLLHAMRAQKSRAEASLLGASAQLSAHALKLCMAATRPGVKEYELAALFEYACRSRGASRMAYPVVAAGGADACTIHYGRNDKALRAGQLVLMDAGCELHGYCSDISRTWPVDGRFTPAQRAVYDVVLAAHASCVHACRPGASLRDLHALSVRLISEGLLQLGACGAGVRLRQIEGGLYRRFYWHSVGHWLGLDTHDTPLVGYDRPLEPGMVLTIEPGVYIPDEARYGALRGVGVRIEDDVLVTREGCKVLSEAVPRRPEDIEELVGCSA